MADPDERFDPAAARDFAVDTVRRLVQAGHVALFAGGCVRDELLGKVPKDFDVATDARPEQVRTVFGHRRTLAIGAAFGVIERIGSPVTGHVQIATFRSDGAYSDGRRPDAVVFSSPREDALRRDFTINGMFLDPATGEVLDFVGGRDDLAAGVIRAIGDPRDRIAEDKLRMLRAPRFAARYGFALDGATAAAIRTDPAALAQVSPERIADEMRRMLGHPSRARAVTMLADLGLWPVVIVPEANPGDPAAVARTLDVLDVLDRPPVDESVWKTLGVPCPYGSPPPWPTILAAILRAGTGWWGMGHGPIRGVSEREDLRRLRRPAFDQAERWRLSNAERDDAAFLLVAEYAVRTMTAWSWPDVQPYVADPLGDEATRLAWALHGSTSDWPFPQADRYEFDSILGACQRRAWPASRLDPPPLLTGSDLQRLGVPPGPGLGRLLTELRREQLDERIAGRAAAEAWVRGRLGDAAAG